MRTIKALDTIGRQYNGPTFKRHVAQQRLHPRPPSNVRLGESSSKVPALNPAYIAWFLNKSFRTSHKRQKLRHNLQKGHLESKAELWKQKAGMSNSPTASLCIESAPTWPMNHVKLSCMTRLAGQCTPSSQPGSSSKTKLRTLSLPIITLKQAVVLDGLLLLASKTQPCLCLDCVLCLDAELNWPAKSSQPLPGLRQNSLQMNAHPSFSAKAPAPPQFLHGLHCGTGKCPSC